MSHSWHITEYGRIYEVCSRQIPGTLLGKVGSKQHSHFFAVAVQSNGTHSAVLRFISITTLSSDCGASRNVIK